MTYNYFMIDLHKVWDQLMIELTTQVNVVEQLMTALRASKQQIYVAKCTLCTFSSLVQKYTANSIAHKLGKEKSSFHEIKQKFQNSFNRFRYSIPSFP